MRAVLYLRQSVAREDSISLELQETAGREYCRQRGYTITAVESDPGISGRTWKRPAVLRVMGMIESKQADVIVLWKWSRLSRSRLDWAVAADKVESTGGRIESATEPLDVSTSAGRLARGMLTEFAAFESERIGDIWKETHERRVRQGLPANGKPRFGYQYTKGEGFSPDPVTGPVLADLYRRYLSGQSVYSLVKYLNDGPVRPVTGYGVSADGLWSARTVRRILDQGFGAGFITRHGERVPGIHEPVITPAEWEEYLSRRETRRVTRTSERSPYLLSGLIRCSCGSRMNAGQFGADRKPKYRCKASTAKQTHSGGYVMSDYVERAVFEWLTEVAADVDAAAGQAEKMTKQAKAAGDQSAKVARQLLKLDARLDQLTNKMLDGTIPQGTYERLRDENQAQRKTLERALHDASTTVSRPATVIAPELLKAWPQLPVEARRDILSRLIDYVEVSPGRPRAKIVVRTRW